MRIFLLAIAVIVQVTSYSQVDPHKLDSLRRATDSMQKEFKVYQDSFQKTQDSIYRTQVKDAGDAQNTIQYPKRDKKQKQKAFLYILIGLGFLVLLIVGLLRKGKRRDKE